MQRNLRPGLKRRPQLDVQLENGHGDGQNSQGPIAPPGHAFQHARDFRVLIGLAGQGLCLRVQVAFVPGAGLLFKNTHESSCLRACLKSFDKREGKADNKGKQAGDEGECVNIQAISAGKSMKRYERI